MGEHSPKSVENPVGKREIARYEQFLLFPRCFRKTCGGKDTKPLESESFRKFKS